MPADMLDHPPFPPLEWDGSSWAADINCPEWAGFQTRRGAYAAVSSPAPSDGRLRLRVTVPGDAPMPPSAEQVAAYQYLLAHGAAVRDAVLAAVFAQYPQFREDYLDCFDEDDADFPAVAAAVPELDVPDQLRPLIGHGNLFLLTEAVDGVGYVGFEFGCEWESEHGLGVLAHRGRVVAVGQADTAFGSYAAGRDAAERGGG